jgi:Xaa-Pro aminopeptidase
MRLDKVRTILTEQELDAILIGQPENRRYVSGFTGSAGWLLVTDDQALLATDFRYHEQVSQQAPGFELAKIVTRFPDLLPELLRKTAVKRLGFESQHITVDMYDTLTKAGGDVEWVPLKDAVEGIRVLKEEAEVEALRRSAALNDAAFAHFLNVIQPGMTEVEAAWQIETYMRTHGASKVAFDLIVAAGPNGALPHARPRDHAIQNGEPIVVDIGCNLDGYCSDMTRTVCLGEPSAEYLKVWETVLKAQKAAAAGVRAGVSGKEVDALARDLIEDAGYGERFGHGLGHGVGLVVHEKPGASRLSEDILEAGMSLTIEPGIYLPGKFGVRIEDLVIVREEGIENLSNTLKTPVVKR